MNKAADPTELIQLIKGLPLEERELIAAELLKGIHDDGGSVRGDVESDTDYIQELERRADEAIDHSERGMSPSESIAFAREALVKARSRRTK